MKCLKMSRWLKVNDPVKEEKLESLSESATTYW